MASKPSKTQWVSCKGVFNGSPQTNRRLFTPMRSVSQARPPSNSKYHKECLTSPSQYATNASRSQSPGQRMTPKINCTSVSKMPAAAQMSISVHMHRHWPPDSSKPDSVHIYTGSTGTSPCSQSGRRFRLSQRQINWLFTLMFLMMFGMMFRYWQVLGLNWKMQK